MKFLTMAFLWLMVNVASAHSVKQLYFDLTEAGESWEVVSTFDAGYALPEMRANEDAPQPQRDWLVKLSAEETERLLVETEKYLRASVYFTHGGQELAFEMDFPDYNFEPASFPVLLNGGAYLTVRLHGQLAEGAAGEFQMHVRPSVAPTYIVSVGGEGGLIEVKPGRDEVLFTSSEPADGGETEVTYAESAGMETMLLTGFLHVLPLGLDHVLFILALFLMARNFRTLLAQSLAFTVAHSITLGMAVMGGLEVTTSWGGWLIEPLIALSIAVLALENVLRKKPTSSRLVLVFVFGLVHGLGFASSFAVVLQQVDGGVLALALANVGVELAQVTVLAVAWLLTLRWWKSSYYEKFRVASSLILAAVGLFWFVQRVGLI